MEILEAETIGKENKLKKLEIEPQKRYKIIENTPKVEEKEKTLSEQIKMILNYGRRVSIICIEIYRF